MCVTARFSLLNKTGSVSASLRLYGDLKTIRQFRLTKDCADCHLPTWSIRRNWLHRMHSAFRGGTYLILMSEMSTIHVCVCTY